MKILTISASPYLLTKLGKMNSDILVYLKNKNHEVSSLVWHLDTSWFSSMENNGIYRYEKDGNYICDLFPFLNSPETGVVQAYEVIKKVKPDIVITIGDYQDTSFIFAIKSLNTHMFKWMSILTIDSQPINEDYYELFDFMDCIISTTKIGKEEIEKIKNHKCFYVPYGPNHDVFFDKKTREKDDYLKVICCGKNAEASNIAGFMKAIYDANNLPQGEFNNRIIGYIHTNNGDNGEYNLNILKKRFDPTDKLIKFPEKFIGLNDGLKEEELNNEYNKYDVVVDVSVRSGTGLSVLEAMSTGCIPLVTGIGALKEIVEQLNINYLIQSNIYIGNNEEYFEVISINDLATLLRGLFIKRNLLDDIRSESIKVAERYSNNNFLKEIEELLIKTGNKDISLKIDIFGKK